ncbi:type I pullulanase [Mucilaginibacter myungsuensis]|uniref:Type I pullulanase n=1 Tax=Mucilaginibacter myungsuensis TaxID=649104 RepID=A0A929PZ37_9SPHI|nr:type I pullulanase [Mucilaginibacter myungsuensis]MBE9664100.1 type I pullulanase [Mucilaginibacter myungsuensis]MDN3601279.1 type I pullulanase [Mucilaginibacter myungsuensis]
MKLLRVFNVFILMSILFVSFKPAAAPVYTGTDLGVTYTAAKTTFKIWSPTATQVKLRLYAEGLGGEALKNIDLIKQENGVWMAVVNGNLKDKYYTFQMLNGDKWSLEVPDIYAKAVGVNGKRGMVVNLTETNPAGWATDKRPALKNATDIVLYETHVRDISVDPNSGITKKGKFLGLAEVGTKSPDGLSTGLSHIKELGATHVHLLPSFDFATVDETKPAEGQYNWGYDPQNYNVPEGSYSTDPFNGNIRIKEFKQMVKTMHANGLRVILDVVYNHTNDINHSNFQQFAPDYFYRKNADGSYANGTGCGNETASEQPMMRSFMVQSVLYWAKEYHLDGFRFDLMGTHDITTMNAISDALHKYDSSVFIYGEGWTAGATPLPEGDRSVKAATLKLHKIAAFGDDMRDGLKGAFSDVKAKGFVSAQLGLAESVKFGIAGAVQHPQINYQKVNYSKQPWAGQPTQAISYVSCHDDNTLFDRLRVANPNATEAELIKMDKLSNTAVLTSQGVTFLHSGVEMLRSKKGVANSYQSPDSINQIDWHRKAQYLPVYNYYKDLVHLRKNHPAFRMATTVMIQQHLKFLDTGSELTIAYQIKGNANGDKWKNILVVLNGNAAETTFTLPAGNWTQVGDGEKISEAGISKMKGEIKVPGTTGFILYQ